jgi:molecular chaperone GrpE
VHEAVQHSTSPDVDGPTVTAVLRRGYTFGDKLVRPALVAVTDHEPATAEPQAEEN